MANRSASARRPTAEQIARRRAALVVLADGAAAEIARGIERFAPLLGALPSRATRFAPAECGLVMLRGRIGGDGAPFNLGEATVTRAAVRLASGETGFGYALGRDREKARLVALCDALWQSERSRRGDRDRSWRRCARARRGGATRARRATAATQGRLLHHGARRGLSMSGRAVRGVRRSGVRRAVGVPRRDGRDGAARHDASDRRGRCGAAAPLSPAAAAVALTLVRPRHAALARSGAAAPTPRSPPGCASTPARRSSPTPATRRSRWSPTRPSCRRSTPSRKARRTIPIARRPISCRSRRLRERPHGWR